VAGGAACTGTGVHIQGGRTQVRGVAAFAREAGEEAQAGQDEIGWIDLTTSGDMDSQLEAGMPEDMKHIVEAHRAMKWSSIFKTWKRTNSKNYMRRADITR
jgi:hypothetical protein